MFGEAASASEIASPVQENEPAGPPMCCPPPDRAFAPGSGLTAPPADASLERQLQQEPALAAPPADVLLERRLQQEPDTPAPLTEAAAAQPRDRRRTFVLFNAMPGGLVSACIHLALFLLLSLYAINDADRGARSISLFPADFVEEDAVDAFDELIIDSPPASDDTALEAIPDQSLDDNAMLAAPEIAAPEPITSPLETVSLAPELAASDGPSPRARSPGFMVGDDARGGLARRGDRRQQALLHGATADSENAVQLALQWLVRHQREDGSWCFNQQLGEHRCVNCSCSAAGPFVDALNGATGMVLLAVLGAGHTPLQGDYRTEISAGLQFLIQHQSADGNLADPAGNMYSHGLATLALCETLAMTRSEYQQTATPNPRWTEAQSLAATMRTSVPVRLGRDGDGNLVSVDLAARLPVTESSLNRAAQSAIKFIERAQHAGGGWRYQPGQPGDTSVVGWQLMALKSAYLAGLDVDPRVAARAVRFLDSVAEDRIGSIYGYTHGARRPYVEIGAPITATTPIGLLCRMYTGWPQRRPGLVQGANRLNHWARPGMGMYFYYYATQVMHHYGGARWDEWNAFMRDYLVQTQSREGSELGSWAFEGDFDNAGRLYCTALAAMTLEVYYRYSPIYGKSSVTTLVTAGERSARTASQATSVDSRDRRERD